MNVTSFPNRVNAQQGIPRKLFFGVLLGVLYSERFADTLGLACNVQQGLNYIGREMLCNPSQKDFFRMTQMYP